MAAMQRKTSLLRSTLIYSAVVGSLTTAQEMDLECPILECSDNLEPGVCYTHDGNPSAKTIKGGLCYDVETAKQSDQTLICPFNTDQYMWIDELLQGQERNELDMKYKHTSQLEQRQKNAYCKDAGYLKQMLNPGRTCQVSSQCKSKDCREVCVGYEEDDTCHTHADCVIGHYCHDETKWPFKSVCKPYRADGDECTEDYQCPVTHYCWYKSKKDKDESKRGCMELYSQPDGTKFGWLQTSSGRATLEEYTENGKFCTSGLAYQNAPDEATCTSTSEIKFAGEVTNAPYNCIATDPNKKCKIYYDDGGASEENYVEVLCKCSMSDQTSGFCGSVIGTDTYAKAMRSKKLLYRESECHSLDRENMRAQRDICGIGDYTDEWRFAVDQQFNVTNWPYVQDNQIYHCVQKFFSDSFINESLDWAQSTSVTVWVLALGATATALF